MCIDVKSKTLNKKKYFKNKNYTTNNKHQLRKRTF